MNDFSSFILWLRVGSVFVEAISREHQTIPLRERGVYSSKRSGSVCLVSVSISLFSRLRVFVNGSVKWWFLVMVCSVIVTRFSV